MSLGLFVAEEEEQRRDRGNRRCIGERTSGGEVKETRCYQGKEAVESIDTDLDYCSAGSGVNHAKPYVISKGKKEENA